MSRSSLLLGATLLVCLGVVVWGLSLFGEFIPSTDETRFGAQVTDADRQALQATTGLELPATAHVYAYHYASALDQQMVALVTMTSKEAEAVLAQPPLAGAEWRPADGLPTPASDLGDWPSSWGEPTAPGRHASIDAAPGRQLDVWVGEGAPNTKTLQISWNTF